MGVFVDLEQSYDGAPQIGWAGRPKALDGARADPEDGRP